MTGSCIPQSAGVVWNPYPNLSHHSNCADYSHTTLRNRPADILSQTGNRKAIKSSPESPGPPSCPPFPPALILSQPLWSQEVLSREHVEGIYCN